MLDATHRIRDLAYQLWEQKGRPPGSDLECWLEAERLVDSERQAASTPAKPARKPRAKAEAGKPPSAPKSPKRAPRH